MAIEGRHFAAAVALSLMLHGLLLGLPVASKPPAPKASPPAFAVRMVLEEPTATVHQAVKPKPLPSSANVNRTAKASAKNVEARAPAPSPAAATEPIHAAAPEAREPSDTHQRPLNLSPQAISQAARSTETNSTAPRAIDQITKAAPKEPNALALGIASSATPDCLHVSTNTDGELQVSGLGLFALPVIAYDAMTGKCK